MKKVISNLSLFLTLIMLLCIGLAASSPKNELNKHNSYSPFAIGAVRIENGIGEIKHPKIKWNSIIVYSLYNKESGTVGEKTICWAVDGLINICSDNPDEVSLYTFAIYDGDAPGVIFPESR